MAMVEGTQGQIAFGIGEGHVLAVYVVPRLFSCSFASNGVGNGYRFPVAVGVV